MLVSKLCNGIVAEGLANYIVVSSSGIICKTTIILQPFVEEIGQFLKRISIFFILESPSSNLSKVIITMVIRPLDDPQHDVINLWSSNLRPLCLGYAGIRDEPIR